MAQDIFAINVMLDVTGPDYELNGCKGWDEHYHGNKELKEDVVAAVKELLENTLSSVMMNGIEMDLSDIVVQLDGVEVNPEPYEQEVIDKEDADKNARWNAFHAEITRREEENPEIYRHGVYSMGSLEGPVSQLDKEFAMGVCKVVIADGWDDEKPVYSTSVIEHPTNWDMFMMFCEAAAKSNDKHHVFLEGLEFETANTDGIQYYRALTGS